MPPSEGARSIEAATRIYRYDAGASGAATARRIAVETPVEIAFGGAAFAVMMATPADLEDFAYGFALTEGAVEALEDIRGVEVAAGEDFARIDIVLAPSRLSAVLARKRAMTGRTGCGVCGVEDLKHLPSPKPLTHRGPPPSPRAVGAALKALESLQPLNAVTRAVHGAAWSDSAGRIAFVREDVGRHNALDKLIGALLQAGVDPASGFVIVTSRCSFEMVAKTVAFGAGALVAMSAPTSLALRRAEEAGLELIAIARADHATTFAKGEAA